MQDHGRPCKNEYKAEEIDDIPIGRILGPTTHMPQQANNLNDIDHRQKTPNDKMHIGHLIKFFQKQLPRSTEAHGIGQQGKQHQKHLKHWDDDQVEHGEENGVGFYLDGLE